MSWSVHHYSIAAPNVYQDAYGMQFIGCLEITRSSLPVIIQTPNWDSRELLSILMNRHRYSSQQLGIHKENSHSGAPYTYMD